MNIINKLTFRHLFQNKKRTAVTICGIIVSVAMITAVVVSLSSLMNMLKTQSILVDGDWMYEATNMDYSELNSFKSAENVKDVYISVDAGNLVPHGKTPADGEIVSGKYSQPDMFEHIAPITLKSGRLPKNESEIVINDSYIRNNSLNWKVGDKVKFDRYDRYFTNEVTGSQDALYQFNPYAEGEKSEYKETVEYTIVGIAKNNRVLRDYDFVAGLTDVNMIKDKVDVVATADKINFSTWDSLNKINDTIKSTSVSLNADLLRYSGYIDTELIIAIFVPLAIILGIIIIASVALIYNSFSISLNERSRYLGMLASVGATKKQKRATVYFEGAILGAIGIPLGILAGVGGMGVTFMFIGDLISGMFTGAAYNVDAEFKLVVPFAAVAVIVAVSILTLLISAYIPARKASKSTAIESLRSTDDIKASVKSLRSPKLIRKIFGYEGELAYKNIRRNKKKYKVIIASISVSVILFLTVTSFSSAMKEAMDMASSGSSKDIYIETQMRDAKDRSDEAMNKYLSQIGEYSDLEKSMTIEYQLDSKTLKFASEKAKKTLVGEEGFPAITYAFGYDKAEFEAFCKKYGLDAQEYYKDKKKAIIVNEMTIQNVDAETQEKSFEKFNPYAFKKGDEITAIDHDNKPLRKIVVGDMVEDNVYNGMAVIIMPTESLLAGANFTQSSVLQKWSFNVADADKADEVYNKMLSEGALGDSFYNNSALSQRQQRNMLVILDVFIYGFIALITMISIANILNTISTGIELRRREFAMIRSVGMTPKGFRKMIVLESLIYGLSSLLISLPISLAAHIGIVKAIGSSFEGIPLFGTTTLISYAIAILAVFLIVGCAMFYSIYKIKDDNIVETLKGDNV